jgi:hypothetical protein
MNMIVVCPGRFHPWHKGHKASYDYLVNKFGANSVFVVTSDVQAPITNPFSFDDKEKMMTKTGVPASKIARVKNPYQAQEITQDIPDPENTALVFAVSQKDMEGKTARFKFGTKRDGSPSYMQPYPANGKNLQPLTKHAYVFITPTVNFKVKGRDANSASEIRKLYMDGNEQDRNNIINDLFGEVDATLKQIFDRRLLPAKTAKDIVYKQAPLDANTIDKMPMRESRDKMAKLIETILRAEQRAAKCYESFQEDLRQDYLEEKR